MNVVVFCWVLVDSQQRGVWGFGGAHCQLERALHEQHLQERLSLALRKRQTPLFIHPMRRHPQGRVSAKTTQLLNDITTHLLGFNARFLRFFVEGRLMTRCGGSCWLEASVWRIRTPTLLLVGSRRSPGPKSVERRIFRTWKACESVSDRYCSLKLEDSIAEISGYQFLLHISILKYQGLQF